MDGTQPAVEIPVYAWDADSDPTSFTVISGPENGTLSFHSGGTGLAYTYTPNTDWLGTDSFVIAAYDGYSYSAYSYFSVTVNS
jgi:hypothetical protein